MSAPRPLNSLGDHKRLSEGEHSTLTNALQVALERYRENAQALRDAAAQAKEGQGGPMMMSKEAALGLAEQFDRQVTDAEDMIRLICRADTVNLFDLEPEDS